MKKLLIISLMLSAYVYSSGQLQQSGNPSTALPADPDKMTKEMTEIWDPEVKIIQPGAKDSDAHSNAIVLFNRGKSTAKVVADWTELQLSGKQSIRDLWRQKELGVYKDKFSVQVLPQGVVMVKIALKK